MQSRNGKATMQQVAARAQVSTMTVSYTFNRPERVAESTRFKVLVAARALGFTGPNPVARSLRYNTTRSLGIVLGEHLTYAFDDPQATLFLAGVADICAERNYGMHIVPTTGINDSDRITSAAVDAFIVWTTADDDPVLDALEASMLNVVMHGVAVKEHFGSVGIDNRAAAREMGLKTFANSKRPAIVCFPVNRNRETFIARGLDIGEVTFPVTRERLLGFRDAAGELGVPWAGVTVGVCSSNDVEGARATATRLLTGAHSIDSIAAMSDQQALGALHSANALGLTIPESITLSGWDDSAVAAERAFSSVHQDLRAQGATCALLALGESNDFGPSHWSVAARASTR